MATAKMRWIRHLFLGGRAGLAIGLNASRVASAHEGTECKMSTWDSSPRLHLDTPPLALGHCPEPQHPTCQPTLNSGTRQPKLSEKASVRTHRSWMNVSIPASLTSSCSDIRSSGISISRIYALPPIELKYKYEAYLLSLPTTHPRHPAYASTAGGAKKKQGLDREVLGELRRIVAREQQNAAPKAEAGQMTSARRGPLPGAFNGDIGGL